MWKKNVSEYDDFYGAKIYDLILRALFQFDKQEI